MLAARILSPARASLPAATRTLSLAVAPTKGSSAVPSSPAKMASTASRGEARRAIAAARETLDATREALGDLHPRVLRQTRELANLLSTMGEAEEADALKTSSSQLSQGLYSR